MSIDLGSNAACYPSAIDRDLINKAGKSIPVELVIINRYVFAISCGRSEARDVRPEMRHSTDTEQVLFGLLVVSARSPGTCRKLPSGPATWFDRISYLKYKMAFSAPLAAPSRMSTTRNPFLFFKFPHTFLV